MLKTDNIIILGGGSAGWMTAATMCRIFPEKNITVIESPNTPIIGVGESTLGHINRWLSLLGIKDEDFMQHTDASYKLSIRFEDFYEKGDGGFHYPFGSVIENNLTYGKQNWFFKRYENSNLHNSDYATFINTNMALVNNNTIFTNSNNELPGFDFTKGVAYHFDATKFGLWLRDYYCKPRNVKHIVEDITDIETDSEGIKSLNKKYTADLFFDCTGFKSMLMNELNNNFISYNDLLPNNSAWATRVPYKNKEEQLEPYTNCTAIENGWVWNIPSWERIGTGYVYSDKYVSDGIALEEFKKHLSKKGHDYSQSQFKNIKMRVGRYEKLFLKNVCAIGLSAGFIEPLESNGLLSVHEFLLYLVDVMTRHKTNDSITQFDIDSYNVSCSKFFDEFTDFVALHYALSNRDDTKYWKDVSEREYIKYAKSGDLIKNISVRYDLDAENDYYSSYAGAHYISTGMNFYSKTPFNLMSFNADTMQIGIENKVRDIMVKEWDNIAKKQPKLINYLKDNIHRISPTYYW